MLNNIWSFSDRKITGMGRLLKNFVPYFTFSSIPILFRFWLVGFVTSRAGDTYLVYNLTISFSILIGLFWNFFTYSRFIWSSEEKAQHEKYRKKIKEVESKAESEKRAEETVDAQEKGMKNPEVTPDEKDPELQKRIAEKMAQIKGE